jgi:hypothetical protein
MSRRAEIRQAYRTVTDDENYYVVDLFENDRLVQIRELPGKSRHYAEDVVENWENGIIQLLTE